MILIEPRHVILNILQAHESFDMKLLQMFAVEFKKRYYAAYVDISGKAVRSFFEDYQEIVDVDHSLISRKEEFDNFASREFLDDTINREFPPLVKHILKLVSENLKRY